MKKYMKTDNWNYSLSFLGKQYRRALLCGYLFKEYPVSFIASEIYEAL
jgi:hypothetical protein